MAGDKTIPQQHTQLVPNTSEFVQLCLGGRWEPASLQTARAIAQQHPFAWDTVYQTAQAAGLTPLLYSVTRDQNVFPSHIEKKLHNDYYNLTRRNIILFQEIEAVLQCLAKHGVAVILLKGAALAQTVYRNIAVRPMSDLDLLVHRKDVANVLHAISELGYHTLTSVANTSEVVLCKPDQSTPALIIDLHWNLFASSSYYQLIAPDWFWETALPVHRDDATILTLGPEAQVLHLCGHLLLHHGGIKDPKQLWLHDIAEVINFYKEQMNWDRLLAQAKQFELVLSIQQVLPRLSQDWQIPIPHHALKALHTLRPSNNERYVFTRLSTCTNHSIVQRFWCDLASLPNWKLRLRFAWLQLFPPVERMIYGYHITRPILLPWYYIYRWALGLEIMLHAAANSLQRILFQTNNT